MKVILDHLDIVNDNHKDKQFETHLRIRKLKTQSLVLVCMHFRIYCYIAAPNLLPETLYGVRILRWEVTLCVQPGSGVLWSQI
jgi:hypothetical protein